MKRIEYNRYGGPEELHMIEVNQGTPVNNQIRTRIKAASTNPVDWNIRAGAVKMPTGKKFPRGVGSDFAGVVEAIGANVKRFKVGDNVFGAMTMKASSTFAEAIITEEDTAAVMSEALKYEDASTLPIAGSTAWTDRYGASAIRAERSDQRLPW